MDWNSRSPMNHDLDSCSSSTFDTFETTFQNMSFRIISVLKESDHLARLMIVSDLEVDTEIVLHISGSFFLDSDVLINYFVKLNCSWRSVDDMISRTANTPSKFSVTLKHCRCTTPSASFLFNFFRHCLRFLDAQNDMICTISSKEKVNTIFLSDVVNSLSINVRSGNIFNEWTRFLKSQQCEWWDLYR